MARLLYVKSMPYVSFVTASGFSEMNSSPSRTVTGSSRRHARRSVSAPSGAPSAVALVKPTRAAW
jgi:hypothetical protein